MQREDDRTSRVLGHVSAGAECPVDLDRFRRDTEGGVFFRRAMYERPETERVETVVVTSSRFSVERSGLHVGSPLGAIFRYYGNGKDKIVPGGILIQYPEQGIDFIVNKQEEKITEITIYRPQLPEFRTKDYGKFKEQLKQKP